MRKHVLLLGVVSIVGSCAAFAQAVSFGVKGGVPFGDLNSNRDESRPYLVGPTVELRLPANFAIEVDALYRRVGNSSNFLPAGLYLNRDRGNSWEFPFLGKYYFRSQSERWHPFVGVGGALRATWFHSDTSSTQANQNGVLQTTKYHSSYIDSPGAGGVIAGGIQFHRGRFSFAPELRYTRWASANFERNTRNEGGILFGITF